MTMRQGVIVKKIVWPGVLGCRCSGVTVIELLVTLSIVVVLLTVVAPGFGELIGQNRRAAAMNELIGSLNMARSEAIKTGARVALCPSSQPEAPAPVCDPQATWSQGWLIFLDNTLESGNQMGRIDGTDRMLRAVTPDQSLVIESGSHYARGLYFDAKGMIWGINSSGSRTVGNDTFTVTAGGVRLCLAINKSGRASTRVTGQASCQG
jgi:type IV fimbrial biogenesis protein FimT